MYCLVLIAYMLPDPHSKPDHTKVVKIVPVSCLLIILHIYGDGVAVCMSIHATVYI